MISVTDLVEYQRCKRRLWLSKIARIEKPNIGYTKGRRFHSVVNDLYSQIAEVWQRQNIPGIIVEREKTLEYDGLRGRLDCLRKLNEGYAIQDEKYLDPPRKEDVYESHKLQLNAYAYLAERNGFTPVKSLYIIYDDLRPREIKPDIEKIPALLKEVKEFISNANTLPPIENGCKCEFCSYHPICQILPASSGLTVEQIMFFRQVGEQIEWVVKLKASMGVVKDGNS